METVLRSFWTLPTMQHWRQASAGTKPIFSQRICRSSAAHLSHQNEVALTEYRDQFSAFDQTIQEYQDMLDGKTEPPQKMKLEGVSRIVAKLKRRGQRHTNTISEKRGGPDMKKRNPILVVICMAILAGLGFYIFQAGAAKAEITINGKTYAMRAISVRDFMSDGYVFSTMSIEGNTMRTYNYSDAVLEAKSYYNSGVPFKVKGSAGASINCWVYNPTSEKVEIREGKINSISCDIQDLLADGVKVSVAGLEMGEQTKAEIKDYMDGALKGYQFSENEDVNAISYTKGQVSYTFSFDDGDVLKNAIARNSV